MRRRRSRRGTEASRPLSKSRCVQQTPRYPVDRVVSSRLLDLVLASSPPLVLVVVLVFLLLSLRLLFSFS